MCKSDCFVRPSRIVPSMLKASRIQGKQLAGEAKQQKWGQCSGGRMPTAVGFKAVRKDFVRKGVLTSKIIKDYKL